MGLTNPEIAMITLASIIGIPVVAAHRRAQKIRIGSVFATGIMHITILSLGIDNGGDRTLFISYMCWAWTYLFTSTQNRDLLPESAKTTEASGLGGLWWAAILGTAIASAAYNTHNPMDNHALCIFGLVTTTLMLAPILLNIDLRQSRVAVSEIEMS